MPPTPDESAAASPTPQPTADPSPQPTADASAPPTVGELRAQLSGLGTRDAAQLDRRLRAARKLRPAPKRHARLRQIAAEIAAASASVETRRDGVPTPSYPPDLPITARREEILRTIRDHQVVVIAGETGSGKSTQLPKMCLEAGGGVRGLIGHTQPRRIAARAVAERVAEELGVKVGDAVGYQMRFHDTTTPATLLKVMTDGILLAEIQRDRDLRAYDTLIIDEAHERSLNIDFILGYLRNLLPRRPDLKIVITSATIDTERFADHFADADGHPAPIIEVSGRTYPVEQRYRPLDRGTAEDPDAERRVPKDLVDGICDAVKELATEGPGDILVFAAGERDIRDAAHAIERLRLARTEVLPLYSRLSAAEQHRVFSSHPGRRIVIATNIAETSLTVPGIRYVIDPGLARISRYSRRTKVQRLPIEEISQASADQRAGRCGRLGPGICIRLYDEESYLDRPEFTEPEILRTNLASVILQMASIGIASPDGSRDDVVSVSAIEDFPFVEPPDRKAIADGLVLLEELGALTSPQRGTGKGGATRRLTGLGRKIASLPTDPQLARMILAAEEEGCVRDVLVITAALSIQDPRERPAESPERAAALHARFTEPGSDFLAYRNLWEYLRGEQQRRSASAFRRLCRDEHLHYLRIREWQDLYTQLKRVARELGIPISHAPTSEDRREEAHDAIHRALLSGLLSNIGARDGERRPGRAAEYQGTRGTTFLLGRRSSLADNPPAFVMAAELVETNRLWASTAARIRAEWVEPLAGELVTRTYGEPYWSSKAGAAMVSERVSFRGVVIVPDRRVPLSRRDPELARAMFISKAMVEGDWRTHHRFFRETTERIEQARAVEERARRRGLIAPDDRLFAFYDQRVGQEVTSAAHFDTWWNGVFADDPTLLDLPDSVLYDEKVEDVDLAAFPDSWSVGGEELPLTYAFDPDDPASDGVTVDVPLGALHRMDQQSLSWHVEGLRLELVTTLIRGLPKTIRRLLVPAPDTARQVLATVGPEDGPFHRVLAAELSRRSGVQVTPTMLQQVRLPAHLRLRYRVVEPAPGSDDGVRELATSDDLTALQAGLRQHVANLLAAESAGIERDGLVGFDVEEIPRRVTTTRFGHEVVAFPSLVVADDGTVNLRLLQSEAAQRQGMWAGTRALLVRELPSPVRPLGRGLGDQDKLVLTLAPHPDVAAVARDCQAALIDAVLTDHHGPAYTRERFELLRTIAVGAQQDNLLVVGRLVATVVRTAQEVRTELGKPGPAGIDLVRTEVAQQLGRLVFPGFVQAAGIPQLPHLPRYVKGLAVRLQAFRASPHRERGAALTMAELDDELLALRRSAPGRSVPGLDVVRWQIEELRVGLLAEQLGTAQRVSETKIRKRLRELRQQL